MAHFREDSLLFSLRALAELEQERIEEQHARHAERERALARSQAEEERLRREAEARRARAEIARKREEALRQREEEARIQAMREAIIEKGRVEAEWKGRLELETQQRHHTERMAELASSLHRRRARVLAFFCVVIAMVGAILVVVAETRGRDARRLADELAQNLHLERESRTRTARLLELSEQRVDELSRDLEAARAARPRGGRTTEPAPVRVPTPEPLKTKEVPAPSRPAPKCGDDGDPLDGCLP